MSSSTSFETTIISALDARSQGVKFPLKFNDVWQESGYSRKNNAVKAFKENCSDLIRGEDYDFDHEFSQNTKQRGRPYDDILLTVEAYNFFLARARTPEGTAKLRYLILIEKQYRKNLERQLTATAQPKDDSINIKELKDTIKQQQKEIKRLADILETSRKLQFENHFQNSFIWHCISHLESIQNDNDLCDRNSLRITPQMIYTMSSKIQESMTISDNLNKTLEIDGCSGDYGIQMFKTLLEVEKFRNGD